MDYKTEREVETKLLHPLFRDTLGYPEDELDWDRPVPMQWGHEKKTKFADLVAKHRGRPVITVEAKKPTEVVRSWYGQVDSYAAALETPYSIITNGHQFVLRGYFSFNSRINVIDQPVQELRQDSWDKLKGLISFDNIPSSFLQKANEVPEPSVEKIQDYRRFFRKIHNEIRDRDKLDPAAAFDELSKLLFLKAAEDEWRGASRRPVLTPEKISEWETLGKGKAQTFVNEWFQAATSELFPGVFDDHPRIGLSPDTLKAVLDLMAPFHVKDGDVDVKGRAFEEFLPSQLRGKGLGQFFTPRPIVNLMAGMAAVSIQDVVVDFSCGSGGFLIKAFEQMQRYVEQLPAGTLSRLGTSRDAVLNDIKERQIFGVDAEPRAARTAKMNMLMWGDGRRVVRGNALDTKDFLGNPYEPGEHDSRDPTSGCTLILANPPFGSKEKDAAVLGRYTLGSLGRAAGPERTEVLFIEKGLKLLRPEGKMLIVLPQGLMSNANDARVRDYIHGEAEIRAIVSLPRHTFSPSGVPMVNTCVVYLQKFSEEKRAAYQAKMASEPMESVGKALKADPDFDYPIFMGIAEDIGYEPSGRVTVKPGRQTDLDLILSDFLDQASIADDNGDIFEFAEQRYGEPPPPELAGSVARSSKSSFVVPFSETVDRLDPPYYLVHRQAATLIQSLRPLGTTIEERKKKFKPSSDAELDAEYSLLSVSNDGLVTFSKLAKGEDFTQMRRVRSGDVVYNPMRINIGSVGVVPSPLDGGLVSPDYVVFRSKVLDPDFLVTLLRSPFYRMYIDVTSTGSIRNRLYFGNLQELRVPAVSALEQAAICASGQRADDAFEARKQAAESRLDITRRLNALVRHPAAAAGSAMEAFRALADRWRRETGMLSSVSKKTKHADYQKIMAMGEPAVPMILRELRERPAHWFAALEAITGASPAEGADNFASAASAWIQWGRERGYIDDEGSASAR